MVDPPPVRKRMKRWEIDRQARFVTFSCQRRLPLLSHPLIAEVFVEAMVAARQKHGTEVFAWVVMPEHVHLLVRPASTRPLEPMLRSLKMAVAMRVIPRRVASRSNGRA